MKLTDIAEHLSRIEAQLLAHSVQQTDARLNSKEAAKYAGISVDHLYKVKGDIGYYEDKEGRTLIFLKSDIDNWVGRRFTKVRSHAARRAEIEAKY